MGSEQSTQRSQSQDGPFEASNPSGPPPPRSHTTYHLPNSTFVDPLLALTRDGALSPERQDSVCSEASEALNEVPFVSYTVNKPIGDSPKKQAKSSSESKFRLLKRSNPSQNPARGPRTAHNTMVMVNADPLALGATPNLKDDEDLARLARIPSFLPIMRASLSGNAQVKDPDILERLDYRGLLSLCLRYENHLRFCGATVSTEQAELNKRLRDIDRDVAEVAVRMEERHRRLAKYSEKLSRVRDMSKCLSKCHILLNENIEQMEVLNNMLPPDDRLEPFVWTTG